MTTSTVGEFVGKQLIHVTLFLRGQKLVCFAATSSTSFPITVFSYPVTLLLLLLLLLLIIIIVVVVVNKVAVKLEISV
jgi:hypothetical protein